MYASLLTKKDIVAFNQKIGESGNFNNEGSLDFALSIAKTKNNWLYELSYLTRSLLVDHVFNDGNKRTSLLIIAYYCDQKKNTFDKNRLLFAIKRIAKNNINNPTIIMRLIYNAIREKN
jgi:prophage maintenance system killer protein